MTLPPESDKIPDTEPNPDPFGGFKQIATAISELVEKGIEFLLPSSAPTLLLGSTGPDVERWQRLIRCTVSGVFDAGTDRATRIWQATHGLAIDGIVGPKSWAEALHGGTQHPAPAAQTTFGVDVSQFQPPGLIDYKKLRDSGHTFVIPRACYGTTLDTAYIEHVQLIRQAGLVAGSYAFFRQTQQAQAQFDVLLAQLHRAGIGPGDIVPAVDLETNVSGADGKIDPAAHNKEGRKLVELVADRFGKALVYCSPGHWLEIGKPSWIGEHSQWTAHWGVASPAWPKGWCIWQSSSTYRDAGFTRGPLDRNQARYLPLIGAS